MNSGDQPAFPNDGGPGANGMTYRQWLIGQIASSIDASDIADGYHNKCAVGVILFADSILARLDKERGER